MKPEDITEGKQYRMRNGTVWTAYVSSTDRVMATWYSPDDMTWCCFNTPRNLFAADAVEEVTTEPRKESIQ